MYQNQTIIHHYSSLCMSREAYWWIGSPRYLIASPIRQRMDRGMHHLLNLDHSSHQARIDHLDRTQNHSKNISRTYWEWIETIWTWSPTNIIDCRVVTFTIEVPAMFLNVEFHILFLNRHRYGGSTFTISLFNNIDELQIRVITCGRW